MPVLKAIVGHLDRETTRIYMHLRMDDLIGAVQGLETGSLAVVNILSTSQKSVTSNQSKKLENKVKSPKPAGLGDSFWS